MINCSHPALLTSSPALCPPIHLHRGPYTAVQTSAQTQTGTALSQNHRPLKRKIPWVLSITLVSGPGLGVGDWLKFKVLAVVEVLGKGRAQGGTERRWALLLVLIPAHSWEFALSISTFVYDVGRLRGARTYIFISCARSLCRNPSNVFVITSFLPYLHLHFITESFWQQQKAFPLQKCQKQVLKKENNSSSKLFWRERNFA